MIGGKFTAYRFPGFVLAIHHFFQWLNYFLRQGLGELSVHLATTLHFGGHRPPCLGQASWYFAARFVEF